MKNKKPKMIESVGALHYAFNTPDASGEFNLGTYGDITRSPIIKKVSVEPEEETVTVRASGEDYDQVSQTSKIGLEFEAVAFDPEDLARAKGERIDDGGLVLGGSSSPRPFLAIGYPVTKIGDGYTLKWYPKCKLTENSEEASTSETSFSEQNPTIHFDAYAFNDKGDKFVYLDTEMSKFPEGMTIEKFFSKVITSMADVTSVLAPSAEAEETPGA